MGEGFGVGVGHRWLLLRGLIREKRHWNDFPERLAARSGRDVACLDLPGVGTERHRRPSSEVDGLVDNLRHRFLATRGEGPWALFGVSLGGMIALRWAERHPEDFVRVAVSNTSAREVAGPFERMSPYALGKMLRAAAARDRVARERHVLELISNTDAGRARAHDFASLAAEAPLTWSVLIRQLVAGNGASAPRALEVPLLVLASKGDRMVSHACSVRLAERLRAELHLHPTAGHDLPLDDPDWVLDRLVPTEPAAGPEPAAPGGLRSARHRGR